MVWENRWKLKVRFRSFCALEFNLDLIQVATAFIFRRAFSRYYGFV